MTAGRRWTILAALLAAAVAATAQVKNPAAPDAATSVRPDPPQARPASPARAAADIPEIRVDKMKSRNPGEIGRDPFAEGEPVPARRKSSGNRPASRAAAPPMPFSFAGRFASEDDNLVFLTYGERNLAVREGDVIDSTYRVDAITDQAVTLVYLPLEERQTIVVAGAQP